MPKAKFTRYGPFRGIPALVKKGKKVIGAAPCETHDCEQEVNICIGGDNWLTSTCPQSGCGTTIHGRTPVRARHELDRLKASNRVAHVDTLTLAYAALEEMENAEPAPEPSDQLEFVTTDPKQSVTTAPESDLPEVEEPIHRTDEPGIDPQPQDEDPLAELMENL